MPIRRKYQRAIDVAKNLPMTGSIRERRGKLNFIGSVRSEAEKSLIIEALKTVPDWEREVLVDLQIAPTPDVSAPVSSMKTHTVQDGETLETIALKYLGDVRESQKIVDANPDQLRSSNAVQAGQVLRIPNMDHQLQ